MKVYELEELLRTVKDKNKLIFFILMTITRLIAVSE